MVRIISGEPDEDVLEALAHVEDFENLLLLG
jgi:hypothetical protein